MTKNIKLKITGAGRLSKFGGRFRGATLSESEWNLRVPLWLIPAKQLPWINCVWWVSFKINNQSSLYDLFPTGRKGPIFIHGWRHFIQGCYDYNLKNNICSLVRNVFKTMPWKYKRVDYHPFPPLSVALHSKDTWNMIRF